MKPPIPVVLAMSLLVLTAPAYGAAKKATPSPPLPEPAPKSAPQDPGDLAYAQFQRGYYLSALAEAQKRVEANGDPKAMTLIGVLYGGGLGVGQDDAKAVEWYSKAAERGDREAMFSLAMMRLGGFPSLSPRPTDAQRPRRPPPSHHAGPRTPRRPRR